MYKTKLTENFFPSGLTELTSGGSTTTTTPSYQELFLNSKRGIFPLTERILPEGRHTPPVLFQDTTRLRFMARPSLRDALQSFSAAAANPGRLGRLGISQSFRERLVVEAPPPLPPGPLRTSPKLQQSVEADSATASTAATGVTRSLTKKLFSFNRSEMKRINKFLGLSTADATAGKEPSNNSDATARPPPPPPPPPSETSTNNIYDIAEDDTGSSISSRLYATTGGPISSVETALKPPPRPKRERSKSFTPRSRPIHKASVLFNRSLSQLPKSSSSSSITNTAAATLVVHRSESCRKLSTMSEPSATSASSKGGASSKRTLSSSDLVHIFPEDEERRSFKDIRKILSSPSITSSSSSSHGSTSSQGGHRLPQDIYSFC